MTARTSVATDATGRRVMAKTAGNAEEAVRLEREAEVLEAARHPGVVELVGVDGHGVGAILLTAYVEGPTLAHVGRLPLEEGAGLLAALASTLADLHDLGLVHGAVSPEHVIVGPGGRPVLCGLAYGGRIGLGGLSPDDDVVALGELARFVAPDPPAGHVLGRVAAEAAAADPAARLSARGLAEALQAEVPAARLPRGLDAGPRAPARPRAAGVDPLAALRSGGSRPSRRRPRAGVVAGIVAALAVVGAALALAAPAPTPAPAAPPFALPEVTEPGPTTTRARPIASTSTSTSALPVPTTTVVRPAGCAPTAAILQADVDGDGCPDALRYAGGILEAGSARWAVGREGDQLATGDWGCQGSRTLALFRPSTGEVFRFDGWATPGRDLTATAVARVSGGLALRAADVDRDGCLEVVIERATGAAEVVRLPRAQP